MANFGFWQRSPEEQRALNDYTLNAVGVAGRHGVGFMTPNFRSMTVLAAVEAECGRLGFDLRPSHAPTSSI